MEERDDYVHGSRPQLGNTGQSEAGRTTVWRIARLSLLSRAVRPRATGGGEGRHLSLSPAWTAIRHSLWKMNYQPLRMAEIIFTGG